MSEAVDVTDADFESVVLGSSEPVVVDFWAEWCGPCRQMSPILDEVAAARGGQLRVVKLNVDDNPETTMRYRITGIPAFKVFRDGEEIGELIGSMPKRVFEEQLDRIL